MKRFYENVAVGGIGGGAHGVLLDGRPVRTPGRRPLAVPSRSLASRIAGEWRRQEERIRLDAMPFTRLAATAVDRVADHRRDYVDQISGFGATDLVCYRAPAPLDLAERQARAWQPLIDWASARYDAVLVVTEGVAPLRQDAAALARLRAAVDAHDDFALAALGLAAVASGSLVIALALSEGRIDPAGACDASQLDERWQSERWGADPEAERRRETMREDIEVAVAFLECLREG